MPRPVKCRKVCHFPQILEFLPADAYSAKTEHSLRMSGALFR